VIVPIICVFVSHNTDAGGSPWGMPMIRILVAETLHLVRGALVALLAREGDLRVVAELEARERIVPVALAERPDVAVIGADLLNGDGVVVALQLHAQVPECRVLILGDPERPGSVRRALAAHATGFVDKDVRTAYFADAVRRVAKGERVVEPQLALAALEVPDNPLTPRETDVLRLAAEGAPTAEIAAKLCLANGTVRNYLAAVTVKTGARTRVEAVRIAQRAGWV
jgi:two-component system response regulator DesR